MINANSGDDPQTSGRPHSSRATPSRNVPQRIANAWQGIASQTQNVWNCLTVRLRHSVRAECPNRGRSAMTSGRPQPTPGTTRDNEARARWKYNSRTKRLELCGGKPQQQQQQPKRQVRPSLLIAFLVHFCVQTTLALTTPVLRTWIMKTSVRVRTQLPIKWANVKSHWKNRRYILIDLFKPLSNAYFYVSSQYYLWKIKRMLKQGKFEQQANDSDSESDNSTSSESEVFTLVDYLKSLVPSDLKDLPILGTILFSLATFILILIKAINGTTKGLKLLLFTSFSSLFFSMVSYALKDNEDSLFDLTETPTTELPSQILEEVIKKPKLDINKRMEFELMCIKQKLDKRSILDAYKDLERPPFGLPGHSPPQKSIGDVRLRINEFRYTNAFLCIWWGIEPSDMFWYRYVIKIMGSNPLERPEVFEVLETPRERLLRECEQQSIENIDLKTVSGILSRLLVISAYIGECIVSKSKFSMSKMMLSLKSAREVSDGICDLTKVYKLVKGEDDPRQKIRDEILAYTELFNEFMKTPTYMFARKPRKLKAGEEICRTFEKFYNSLSKEERQDAQSLHGLYVSVNTRIYNYYSSEVMSLSRQEPFIVCISGAPGIGKTQLVRTLMKDIANEHYKIPPTEAVVEITPDDKYWPPLSAQEIAFFDDSCGKKDIAEDLLWNSVKGICSPAFFNAAGAAVSAKINPVNFKIIFTTTNTSYSDMEARVTAASDAATWVAYCRRMIHINCQWNRPGEPDPNNSSLFSPNFEHLTLNLHEMKRGRVDFSHTLTYKQLKEMICKRENRMNTEFNNHLIAYGSEQQSSKAHYSIVLHGRQGQGKSYVIEDLARNLSLAFNMSYEMFTSLDSLPRKRFKNKKVVVLDDIVTPGMSPEDEKRVMEFYNDIMVDGSIVLFGTNVSPKIDFPLFSLDNIIAQRKLNFYNEGLIRRMGFQGYFTSIPMPDQSTEVFVSNMRYYEFINNRVFGFVPYFKRIVNNKWDKFDFIVLGVILASFISFIPLIFLSCFFIYRLNSPVWQEVSQRKLSQHLFERVTNFYANKNGFVIEDVDRIPELEGTPNIVIRCKDSSKFLKVESPKEMDKHVFTKLESFHASPQEWKMYLDEVVLRKMTQNLERFMINEVAFDEAAIFSILNRYIPIFTSLNLKPVFDFRFDDVGDYVYQNSILYRLQRNVFNERPIPTLQYIGEELKVVYLDHNWDLNTFLYNLDGILECFDFEDRRQLTLFHRSREFRENKIVNEVIIGTAKRDAKNMMLTEAKLIKDQINAFRKTPAGIITIVLIGLLAGFSLFMILVKLISKPVKKRKSKKSKKEWSFLKSKPTIDPNAVDTGSDYDSEEITGYCYLGKKEKRYAGRIGAPKGTYYTTSEDEKGNKIRRKKRNYRKSEPAPGGAWRQNFLNKAARPEANQSKLKDGYDSEPLNMEKQDVMTLADINQFDALKKYIDVAVEKARKNLCQVYVKSSDNEILDSEPSFPTCYGLFVKENILVTVGHAARHEQKNTLGSINRLYCGFDNSGGKFYRMHRLFKYHQRDLAVYYVPALKNHFPDISKFFFSQEDMENYQQMNVAFQRFGCFKKTELHTGELTFNSGPDCFVDGKMCAWGAVIYGSHGVKLTEAGDCGLPYYAAELDNKYHNKIFGIHCMGNVEGFTTSGVCAMIFKEDVEMWQKTRKMEMAKLESFDCCSLTEITVRPDDYPKCVGHETVWHKEHESTVTTFKEEYAAYIEANPKFKGGFIKNSGVLYGTHKHSHTQFLPLLDVLHFDVGTTNIVKLSELKNNVVDCDVFVATYEIQEAHLSKFLTRRKDCGADFRIRGYRFPGRKCQMLKLSVYTLIEFKDEQLAKQTKDVVPFPSNFGAPIHVDPTVGAILTGAVTNRERGKLEDVPYVNVEGNQTVKVRGSFSQSKSHLPNNHYQQSPFSNLVKDLIPIEKKPCVYDVNQIPAEELKNIAINNYGIPCQRSTLALAWAHKIYGDPKMIEQFGKEFYTKIATHYADLRPLTDQEVLEGIKDPKWKDYFNAMELDTSIGFTLKQLFYVQKKSDVLGVTEEGKYYWTQKPVAKYVQEQFEVAKQLASEGKKFLNVFTELLKMEKLKLSKIYRGRTFVAEDMLGVMMERRILGMFSARAYKCDPECGIGVDPNRDFNKIYTNLLKYNNIFAIDFKNYDRTIPAYLMIELKNLLKKANPKMANELESVFSTLIERLQVSGTTLSEVFGGLPSGCFVTAPLNSLLNDFIMFSAFAMACEEQDLAWNWRIYNTNVVRYFYGDDGILSVSDLYKDVYHRVSVARIVNEFFGMNMSSSSKEGELKEFDTWEEASWISRFFVKLGSYPVYVGALKKISIGASFHYVSSLDLSHLGQLMDRAQYEAARWDTDYFNTIQQAIRRCVEAKPALAKYVNLTMQETIQKEMFTESMPGCLIRQAEKETEHSTTPRKALLKAFEDITDDDIQEDITDEELAKTKAKNPWKAVVAEPETPAPKEFTIKSKTRSGQLYEQKYKFSSKYFKQVIQRERFTHSMASMQQLNMLFQAGKCTKPKYEDAQDSSLRWASTVSVTRLSDNKHCFGSGYSTTKQAAREEAAYEVMVEDFNGKKHELRTTYLSPEQVSKAKQARETILKSKMEKQTNDPAIPTEHDQIFVVDGIEHVMLREKREPATCEEMDARFEEILENARKWDCEHAPMPSIQTSQTRVRQCDVCGFWYCPKEDEKTCTPKCGVMINPDDSDSDDEPICECDECEGIVPIGTLHKGTSWRDYEDNGLADALEEARLRSLEDWEEIDTSEGLTTVIPENHEEPEVDMLSWERTNFLNNNRQEMNMTPGVVEQVPRPMLQQQDASVVVDGGLFTNSEVFAPLKINNTDAIALDNPAGTGAPFSKHTAVYKLFQRWEEKNTTINESMAKGTEVVRLSLDPSTWPKNLVEYVMFHKSIIPSLEISIAIAGAAGSIGWMTMGWVRDGSPDKTYTLDDLQQVVCETMSMNGTAIFKTVLNDVRQSGLYRKTIGDPEPYPALILMVDHPVTNVQRNNMVNYPLRVMARLAPHCILMEPFGSPSAPSNTDFYLGSYMMTNQLDLIVGSSSATSDQQPTHNLQDYGFKQGQFKPTVNKDNTFMQNMGDIANNTYAIAFTPEATPSATFLEQLAEAGKNATTSQLKNIIPIRIACAIGDVSLPDDMTTFVGTVYTLEKQQVKLGIYSYSITQMYVQNKGCIVMLDLDCVVNDKFLICTNSVKDVKSQAATSWSFYSENKQVVGTFWQDSTHNNAVVGDDFSYNHGTDDDPRLLLNTYADLKEIKLFVQTGNSIPSTNLPTGLKQIHFTRQGTSSTVTEDSPFSNLDNPIIPNVVKALNKIISEKNWNGIGGDLYVDGQNLGQIGYQNGIFFARSDAYRKIKPGITDDIYIRNLFNLQNGQGLAAFQTNGYQNWGSAGKGYSARTIFLNNMRREAAAIGGGLISGLGNGLTQFGYQQWQSGMMDKVLKNQRAIVDANNIALAERAKQAFERNLELRGYGSASMQHGQAGPRTKEETPSEAFTRFVPGGTLPGGSGTNADSLPLEVSPTIIPPRDVKQATVYRADKGIPPQATPVNVGGKSMISTLNPLAEAFKMPSQPTDGAGVSPTNAPDGQAKD